MRRLGLMMAAAGLACGTAVAAEPVTAPLTTADGKSAGQVTLTDAPKGVLVHVEATGLTPGWHAIHFHEKATCGDPGLKASGAHVHGGKAAPVHGLLNPTANDQGDLPNIFAASDGTANADLFSTLVAMRAGTPRGNLLDADGSAVIIHASADDYQSQPIGGAGDRIACAAISK